MAAYISADAETTITRPVEYADAATQNRVSEISPSGEGKSILSQQRLRTETGIAPTERGDDSLRNYGERPSNGHRVQEVQPPVSVGDAVRVRSELARDLRTRVASLIPLVGDVSFPTNIQLLKRDLSRCHDDLNNRASETNFGSSGESVGEKELIAARA